MVHQVQKAGAKQAQYVPITFTKKGENPITISFPKGTELEAKGHGYTATKATKLDLNEAEYAAFTAFDATKDGKFNKEDTKKLLPKDGKNGYGVTEYVVTKKTGKGQRIGAFLPGYHAHNNSRPDIDGP